MDDKSIYQNIPSIVQFMYGEGTKEATGIGLQKMMDSIYTYISEFNFKAIDNIIKHINVRNIAPEYMIGVLRVTFIYKDRLNVNYWNSLLFDSIKKLEIRGYETTKLFEGIK